MQTNYQKLLVWQKSIELVKNIYKITRSFPKDEIYGLISQLKRCAVSIPSNIAEGEMRNSIKEQIQFLYIAKGSSAEVETQVFIAKELNFINNETKEELQKCIMEIIRMLTALISSKKSKIKIPISKF